YWPPQAVAQGNGWTGVNLYYDGSARLFDSSARAAVRNALLNYCRGPTTGQYCLILCHSAGCARVLQEMKTLTDLGTPPDGVYWTIAAGSAAGGAETAEAVSHWFNRLLAKLLGEWSDVFQDLHVNNIRIYDYPHIQNAAVGGFLHLAGSKDICKRF